MIHFFFQKKVSYTAPRSATHHNNLSHRDGWTIVLATCYHSEQTVGCSWRVDACHGPTFLSPAVKIKTTSSWRDTPTKKTLRIQMTTFNRFNDSIYHRFALRVCVSFTLGCRRHVGFGASFRISRRMFERCLSWGHTPSPPECSPEMKLLKQFRDRGCKSSPRTAFFCQLAMLFAAHGSRVNTRQFSTRGYSRIGGRSDQVSLVWEKWIMTMKNCI